MSTAGNLIAEAAQAIEAMIISGQFVSGDKLTEKSLVERLGVSRGTVREALRKLESAGLLEIHDNRGAFVRTHSFKEVLEIFDLRAELTGYATRLLAENGERETLEELQQLVDSMDGTVEKGDLPEYYDLNLKFHETLMRGGGNKRAVVLYGSLVREAHLHRTMQLSTPASLLRSQREHKAILSAIKDGNVRQAESLARAHVLDGKMRYIASFGFK